MPDGVVPYRVQLAPDGPSQLAFRCNAQQFAELYDTLRGGWSRAAKAENDLPRDAFDLFVDTYQFVDGEDAAEVAASERYPPISRRRTSAPWRSPIAARAARGSFVRRLIAPAALSPARALVSQIRIHPNPCDGLSRERVVARWTTRAVDVEIALPPARSGAPRVWRFRMDFTHDVAPARCAVRLCLAKVVNRE